MLYFFNKRLSVNLTSGISITTKKSVQTSYDPCRKVKKQRFWIVNLTISVLIRRNQYCFSSSHSLLTKIIFENCYAFKCSMDRIHEDPCLKKHRICIYTRMYNDLYIFLWTEKVKGHEKKVNCFHSTKDFCRTRALLFVVSIRISKHVALNHVECDCSSEMQFNSELFISFFALLVHLFDEM